MNEIIGKGYGNNHNWEDKGTEQINNPYQRSTLWVCRDCNVMFRHYYHITENILDAIKEHGISEMCIKD